MMNIPNERLMELIDGAADIIYETDGRGHFTFINAAIRSVLGYEPEDFIGHHDSELGSGSRTRESE